MATTADFKREGLGYVYQLPDATGNGLGIYLRARRLRTKADVTYAEITLDDGRDGLIFQAHSNITGVNAQRDLARHLAEATGDMLDWRPAVLRFVSSILSAEREGEPIHVVGLADDDEPEEAQRYLLYPLLAEGKVNMIFGPGGSAKGYLAVASAVAVQTGTEFCAMKPSAGGQVLYLDWEDDLRTMQARVAAVRRGLNISQVGISYRRCRGRLEDQVEDLAERVQKAGITFIVVDSLEMACGAGHESENYGSRAVSFFAALRLLGEGVTVLVIDHMSDSDQRSSESHHAKPIGSVMKLNEVRWGWEVRREQEPGSPTMHVALYHQKMNNGPYLAPLGFKLDFSEKGTIRFAPENVLDETVELAERLPIQTRMYRALERAQPLTVEALAQELGAKADSVRRTADRYKNLFRRTSDGKLGLAGVPASYRRSAEDQEQRSAASRPAGEPESETGSSARSGSIDRAFLDAFGTGEDDAGIPF